MSDIASARQGSTDGLRRGVEKTLPLRGELRVRHMEDAGDNVCGRVFTAGLFRPA
jgi:hypothetical protein